MMSEEKSKLWAEAQRLASSGYTISISEDTLSNGEKVYVLEHPELAGCIAHGSTLDEALDELRQATIDYIYYLLEDGLNVPSPMSSRTVTATKNTSLKTKFGKETTVQITLGNWSSSEAIKELSNDAIQSEHGQESMNISVIEGNLT